MSENASKCTTPTGYLDNILLNGREKAKACAKKLTRETGKDHYVEMVTRNIGDGFKPVFITEYWVRQGKDK